MEVRHRTHGSMIGEPNRLNSAKWEWLFAAVLFAVGFGYSIYTKHVWEDYFITFRHSKNLAEGRGLVFEEGERIHGFTSPIGVLLPAAFHRLAGNPVDFEPALWMFRFVGALVYAAAGFLIVRILRTASPSEPLVPWAGALLFAVEFKSLSFSMNGMETGLMLFFLAWIVRLIQQGAESRWKALGVAIAGLQWTRPDGCIFIAATAVSALAFGFGGPRGGMLKGFVKAGLLSLLLYSPWLIGTTLYYGTPVPHTVMAKSGTQPPIQTIFGPWPTGLLDRMRDRAGAVFEPIYAVFGGWPETLVRFARGVGIAGMVWWMIPFGGPFARFSRWTGLAAFFGVLYLAFVMIFPWYLPPVALLMILSLTAGAFTAPRTFILVVVAGWLFVEMWDKNYFARMDDGRLPFKPKEAWIFVGAALAAFASPKLFGKSKASLAALLGVCGMLGTVAAFSWKEIAVQQEYVETRHRRAIGEWLKAHAKRGETIFLESLGYIGYFSEGRMLDWPGLVSPKVVAARKKIRGHMIDHLPLLEPDWLVLRREYEYELAEKSAYVAANYSVVKEFSVVADLRRDHPNLPGLGYPLHDADYVVLRRRR